MSRPYHALRHRDFRRLLIAQVVSFTGSQMQTAALHWHVYLLTGSALALGLVGLARVLPLIVFSLAGGLAADRWDRRRVMFAAQSVMTGASLGLAALTFLGYDDVPALYLLTAIAAGASAFDNPARQALVPRLVPLEDLPGALSLNLTALQVAMISGPPLAGLLIAGGGAALLPSALRLQAAGADRGTLTLAWIYTLNAASFVAVLITLATMRASGTVLPEAGPVSRPAAALREGLRFVFTTPIMVWTMLLDFVATFFAGSMSLLPIFADQVLHVGPAGYGWLAAAPAAGALVGSVYASVQRLPRRQGWVLLWTVAAYGAATVVYGLSRSFTLTLVALAATGLADLLSTVIRQTIRQVLTPDRLRGRMTAVNMIFFMGGPQLGELEAGLLASAFASPVTGVTVSVVSGGVATVLATWFVAVRSPVVRDYDGAARAAPATGPTTPGP